MAEVAQPAVPGVSDVELVDRVRAGDRASFEAIVVRYEQRVYAACRSLLRDREEAIDVAQDAFLHAFLSIDTLKEVNRLAGWLCGIALTLCKARLRRSRRRQLLWERRPRPSEPREKESFEEWLQQLSEEQRVALGLRYHADLSLNEVADAMGLRVPAAKRVIARGLLKLRTLMRREDVR